MDQEDAVHNLDQETVVHVQPVGVDEGADAHDQEAEQVANTVRGNSYIQTYSI